MTLRLVLAVLAAALVAPAAAAAGAETAWPPGAGVPPGMERTYREAGERFGVAPRLLAAIGLSESRHGASTTARTPSTPPPATSSPCAT